MKTEKIEIKRNKKEYMEAMRVMYNEVFQYAESGILKKMLSEIEDALQKAYISEEMYEIYYEYCRASNYRNEIMRAIGKI